MPGRVLCIGGAVLDRKVRVGEAVRLGTSNPATSKRGFGGVARNVCEGLARLGIETGLASVVGDDEAGRQLVGQLGGLGVDASLVWAGPGRATAEYLAVLEPDGSLVLGLADMGILDALDRAFLERCRMGLARAEWVFADCNATPGLLSALIGRAREDGFRLAVDAVSVAKVARLPADLAGVDLLFLNLDEARAKLRDPLAQAEDAARRLLEQGPRAVVVTVGAAGAILAHGDRVDRVGALPCQPIDVTGAGDALIAGTLAGLVSGMELGLALRRGCLVAGLTTETEWTVHPMLAPAWLDEQEKRLASAWPGTNEPEKESHHG